MNPLLVSLLCATITAVVAYGTLKLGVNIGRVQEYEKRSLPLLAALKLICDVTVSPDPDKRASHETIHTLAAKNLKVYQPGA